MPIHLWSVTEAGNKAGTASGQPEAFGYLYGLTTWLIAGTVFIAVKLVANEMPPWSMAFFRVLITPLVLLPVLVRHRAEIAAFARARGPEALFIGAIGLGLTQGVVFTALHMTTAINVGIIFGLAPLLTLSLARIVLGEAMNSWQAFGSATAFTGIVIISVQGSLDRLAGLQFGLGEIVAFAGALLFASYTVLLKRAKFELPTMPLLIVLLCGGALGTLPFFLWEYLHNEHSNLALNGYLALLYCAVIGGGLSYLCYNRSIEILGAGRAGTLVYTQTIFVAIFAWIFLGERLEWYHYLGGACVAAGVVLVIAKRPNPALA